MEKKVKDRTLMKMPSGQMVRLEGGPIRGRGHGSCFFLVHTCERKIGGGLVFSREENGFSNVFLHTVDSITKCFPHICQPSSWCEFFVIGASSHPKHKAPLVVLSLSMNTFH